MPIHKYRSVSDMPPPGVVAPDQLQARIRAVWNRAMALCPPRITRGVRRFRSIEEANAHRDAVRIERMASTARDPNRG